ncbi:bZIP transcription factor protein [Rutstroemia sp. NJR-2017a BBW]|nr:bZIP transcription factor protein [Rutstroemia sp. NJR-2017a BBW]
MSSASPNPSSSQGGCLDPLDSLIDFSEYETVSYRSPSISSSASKSQFVRPSAASTPIPSPSQPTLSGPSHQYDLYRQQTGIPQGAIASTLAINQNNAHINSRYGFSDGYLSGLSPSEEFVDFGTAPSQTPFNPSDVDMDYDSAPRDPAFFYPDQTTEFVDPSNIGAQTLPVTTVLPTQSSNVGRLWPGMHQQQAALAKAQAQQKQQQAIIQQQRQNALAAAGGQQRPAQPQRARAHGSTDPVVEEKISQLLNSMRHGSVATDGGDSGTPNHLAHVQRMRKEEEDMDEDERLLASEEGKKLSSKERRQLRNKVSARAFRSRRKEYISQLEGEIAAKVNENSDLRSQNRALMEENTRLSDLTRMLLSSPAFSGFLDTLSSNPAAQQAAPAPQPTQVEQPRQVRKDINPYAAQQMQQQHIGMAMIPEQAMDFSMLDINADGGYSYQPQVFSVLSMPETVIDSSLLSGKNSNFVGKLESEDEKVELPVVERAPVSEQPEAVAVVEEEIDEEFDADPAFALYAENTTSATISSFELPEIDYAALGFKTQYELVVRDPEAEKASSDIAFARAVRICDSMEATVLRLEALTLM